MRRFIIFSLQSIAIALLLVAAVREAEAAVKHRYSFTANANDSLGGANGTVIDAGAIPNAVFAGGKLDLSANAGNPSDNITEDAYINLPNGIISALVGKGSLETWVTVETNRNWAEIFSFGRSAAGEDISTGTGKYITLIPDSGNGANTLQLHSIQFDPVFPPFGVIEIGAAPNAVLSPGVNHHIVATYDNTDTMGGTRPDGTVRLYLNGALLQDAPLYPGFTLGSLPDVNNWLGRSQWPDPLFDGSFDEFRIHDNSIGPDQVALNSIVGPDQIVTVPPQGIFSLEVNTVTNSVKLINNVSVALNLNYYEITSAGGALSTGGWSSLDDQEGADQPGQGWDESGGANANQLIELFLAQAGDTIAANEVITLGNAFNKSIFGNGVNGDLAFKYGLTSGALLSGGVTYVTTAGLPGDYDGSHAVGAGDLNLVLNNWAASVPPVPAGWTGDQPDNPSVIGANALNKVLNNWGNVGGSGASIGAVPEPISWASVAMAAIALWRLRPSHRKCIHV
jgi:hypothetical protein